MSYASFITPAYRLAIVVCAVVVLAACGIRSSVAAEISEADREFFERKIRPLLVKRCYECHSAEAESLDGGLALDRARGVEQGGDSGPAIDRDALEKSRLLTAIGYRDTLLQMPPSGKLPEAEIALLTEWVQRGAPYPADDDDAATPAAKRIIDLESERQFWSFQPFAEIPLPAVLQTAWPTTRIDSFLLAKIEEHQLAPSEESDRRTLIRRVTFDLLGLPPTPEEVDEFVSDDDPLAYEKLVDRLLASPQFGERWARVWLDVARYTDVAEPWQTQIQNAWLYRDWVVKALNDDLPYDRFLHLQLAADLMDGVPPADLAALGMLGLSPSYWKELKLDHLVIKSVVAEEWEERIHTLSSGVLGLSVACARCHDHKFDPVSMRDYYALAGVLASTSQTDRLLLPDAEAAAVRAAREEVKRIDDELASLNKMEPKTDEINAKIAELTVQKAKIETETPKFHAPAAHVIQDSSLHVLQDGPHRTKLEYHAGEPFDVAMQIRGNPGNEGPVVPRGFLSVFAGDEPQTFTEGSGRRELAEALTTDAGHLTARVIVNRIWKQHFGGGIVETPSNFGTQGEPPSHPELLNDLARRFVERGWSLKWLHREIVLSSAYRQSSVAGEASLSRDPANVWLSHMNRRRLDIEMWRDAMLAVTNELDGQIGGASEKLDDAANVRRTLYGTIIRRDLNDMLRLHDFPDPNNHSPGRIATTTPLQQLFVLNSEFVQSRARKLAEQIKPTSDDRIATVYRRVYQRSPTELQRERLAAFLNDSAEVARWETAIHALLASNEFLFVD